MKWVEEKKYKEQEDKEKEKIKRRKKRAEQKQEEDEEEGMRRGEEYTWLLVYWLNSAFLLASANASIRNCGGAKSGIPWRERGERERERDIQEGFRTWGL